MNNPKVLITGLVGFIRFHLATKLSKYGHNVIGFSNLNNYYNTEPKYDPFSELRCSVKKNKLKTVVYSNKYKNLKFVCLDIINFNKLKELFAQAVYIVQISGISRKYVTVTYWMKKTYKHLYEC